MSTYICVSVTKQQAERLQSAGPRRDFVELASATNGILRYRAGDPKGGGLLGRLAGPHVWQAASTAMRLRRGDTCFADGEHIGIPLAIFLGLTLKRSVRIVMLGHLVDRRWKQLMFALATRLAPKGTLVLHSEAQFRSISKYVASSWSVELVPYQVDTDFWVDDCSRRAPDRSVLAVGSENRDYATLVEAAVGLNATVRIAAGSHWARQKAKAGSLLPSVEYIDRTLPFAELRDAYQATAVVVVPVNDVANQSGVTVILEAMSMGRPVIVTASVGQRECIQGPLVARNGAFDSLATADRGPSVFGDEVVKATTGWYVVPNDSQSLKAALERLLDSIETRTELGLNARAAALRHFGIDRYVSTLSDLLLAPRPGIPSSRPDRG